MSGLDRQETERPSAVLKAEHQVILRVVRVLERLVKRSQNDGPFEIEAMGQCVKFFRYFADACHHAKEEDLLFPALESRGMPHDEGPIGVMLYEHSLARGFTRDMGDALDRVSSGSADARGQFLEAANKYAELIVNHILKEDNVLFDMGDRMLTNDDQTDLCSRFCEVGCRSFGGSTKETLTKMADDLEAKWSIG